ncbi:MAG TPA: TAXI family TRAP transporter solute-binding subunit [Syntrophales bacterium]|nr:TAXI family TRAP transporter solute-binding subunit [Syntrophales bacterium]
MPQQKKPRHIISPYISNHLALTTLVALVIIAIICLIIVRHFEAPRSLIMTTGFEHGTYDVFGEHYKDILARQKIDLHLLPSSGSVENLKRLTDKSFRVDCGFVQDGTAAPGEADNLVSLGAIGYSPLWVFYRSEKNLDYIAELKGKRIVIGAEGSGARQFAIDLLKLNNSAAPPTVLLDLAGPPAIKALLDGKVDAAIMIGTEDNPLIKELLYSPKVKILSFRQAEAYTRLIPALSHVVLPRGILDIYRKIPSDDVHLLAVTTSLIVRKDLHPALQYLLLDAAVEIHSNAGWVNKKGEFPSPKELSFPSSNYAERFYKSGRPFLLDYLPFGIAAFVDRTILYAIPAAIILIPIIRSIPWLYSWRHRRKFHRWYRELKELELEMLTNRDPVDISGYHESIDKIEAAINNIHVPLAFFDEVYKLKEHVDLVRGKLERMSR